VGGKYDDALRKAWGVYKNADNQTAYRDKYEKLVDETANNDSITQDEFQRGAPPNVVGRTFTKYPPLPQPHYADIPKAYPKVAMPFGTRVDPYAGQAPGPNPTARAFVRPGTPESTAKHEQVHVDTNTLGRPTDRNAAWFNELSPAERLQFKVVKAVYDRENSHTARFDDAGGSDMTTDKGQALANQRKELTAVMQELDRRQKAAGKELYPEDRTKVTALLDMNSQAMRSLPAPDYGDKRANEIAAKLFKAREGLKMQHAADQAATAHGGRPMNTSEMMLRHIDKLESALAGALSKGKKPRK
jgi:hypothetical protein